ncbi:unnamed protein product, partial [Choristocarpus tenellus]
MKGQARVYARVRPMGHDEKARGCKEASNICLKDGKQSLAFLTGERQHWDYTLVFQASHSPEAVIQGQQEFHQELVSLGTSLVDGHSLLLLVAGASGSGKSLTLIGDPEEAKGPGGFFVMDAGKEGDENKGEKKVVEPLARGTKKVKRGKDWGAGAGGGGLAGEVVPAKTKPLVGLLPRLAAQAFATLNHRQPQCGFLVTFSAVSVSAAAVAMSEITCLLPPRVVDGGDSGSKGDGEGKGESLPPPEPPEEEPLWKRSVPARSPEELACLIEAARVRGCEASASTPWHLVARVQVKSINHCSKEVVTSDMVLSEMAEEIPGTTWAESVAGAVRAHASGAAAPQEQSSTGGDKLVEFLQGCLRGTGKV